MSAANLYAEIPDAAKADVVYLGRQISVAKAALNIRRKLKRGRITKAEAQRQARQLLDQPGQATKEHSIAGVKILLRLAGFSPGSGQSVPIGARE